MMATDRERLESVIIGIHGVTDILHTHTELLSHIVERLAELEAWLKEPPSSELPDLLKRLTTAVEQMNAEVTALPQTVSQSVVGAIRAGV